MIVRYGCRLLHFTSLKLSIWSSSCCDASVDFTLYIFTVHLNLRPEGPSRHDVSFDVVEPVDDPLVLRDGRVRFGNCLFGHLEGFVGGEGLDGVD